MKGIIKLEDIRHDYNDIINLSFSIHYHKKMPIKKRAAQFAPFAALKGYYEMIEENKKKHI